VKTGGKGYTQKCCHIHGPEEVKTCIEIAFKCVESDRQKRLTISQIVDELKRIDIEKMSLTHEVLEDQ
jgi:pyruvate dehydrogenase phosphatase